MSANTTLLEVRHLSTWLASGEDTVRAVDGLSFSIEAGETFALLGESGSGKSVTALSIMRLLPDAGRVVSGEIWLEGIELLALPETAMRSVRGRRIAMIFQEPGTSLNPVMTVGDQIVEVLERQTEVRGEAARRRALELLESVGIPDSRRRLDEYPFQMSGGMKQRAMIAIALACNPALLIADEPTTALDVTIQAQVLELLRDLQRKTRMAVLLITHDLGVVAQMAHRVAVMYAGEIVELAPAATFFAAPAHPYSKKLFEAVPDVARRNRGLAVIPGTVPSLSQEFVGCRFASRCEWAWARCREEAPAAIEIGRGQAVRCHLYDSGTQTSGVGGQQSAVRQHPGAGSPDVAERVGASSSLLAVNDLKVYFPIRKGVFRRVVAHVKAVDGVSLEIHSHRTLALVGESGCGKTTVGKGILQLVPVTAGSVAFEGVELSNLTPGTLRPLRKDFQIVFQDPYSSLNPRMRVAEIVEEGMAALGVGQGTRQQRVDQLLVQVGLSPEMKYRYPHEFSGGQRQRLAIARALAVEPKLLICDEPTSALDVSVQAQILNLLKDLQQRLGLAYLFITHNISVVHFLAHEVAVMYLGRIVEKGGVDEVLGSPRHPYTRALLSAVPVIDPASRREVIRLQGELPSPVNPPSGCHFHPRCPNVMPECRGAYPGTTPVSATHSVRCFLYGKGE